jgi:hypothetical protein
MASLATFEMFEPDPQGVELELPTILYTISANGFGTFEMDPNSFVDPNVSSPSGGG